jgi:PAS domain S-box-containing protein
VFDLSLPDLARSYNEKDDELLNGSVDVQSYEGRMIYVDGSTHDVIFHKALARDRRGRPTGIIGTITDITERKRSEAQLRESKDQFTRLVEHSPLSMALVCMDGTIEYINHKAIETFGYMPQDIPNMDRWWVQAYPDEIYRAEVIETWMGLVGEALAHKHEIEPREYRVTCKDRSVKIAAIFGVWVANKVLVIFEDITKRKQAQEAFERESYRNQVFLRNASDGVHILDVDGTVLEASDSFSKMLGYSREELIGANVTLWDAQWSPQELKQRIAEQIANDGRSVFETRHRRRDGSVVDVEVSGQPLELDGKLVLFNSARDITERRRAEERIRKLNEDLERRVHERTCELTVAIEALQTEVMERRLAETSALNLADRLQNMARRLGQAQEAERRRLSAELHDGVCSNLAAIGLNLVLLQKKLAVTDTASMERQLSGLIALIDEAKANAKDISVDLRPLMLDERDLLSTLEEYARKFEGSTGIAVEVRGANSGRRLPAEEKIALFRITQEALTNCAKHALANAVAIELNTETDHLVLSIVDDGVGIDLTEGNRKTRGLGLMSMQERAEAIGGKWCIESVPGKGTRVTVRVGANVLA